MPKFAVYYVPQVDDPFYQLGTRILGYDVRARQFAAPSYDLEESFGPDWENWANLCRPYGFHMTICEALDCEWAAIPRIEQELAGLLKCFSPSHPFVLDIRDEQPVGVWGDGIG